MNIMILLIGKLKRWWNNLSLDRYGSSNDAYDNARSVIYSCFGFFTFYAIVGITIRLLGW